MRPGLWVHLGTVTVGGDTRKARRECQGTLHLPRAMLPVILSLPLGLAPDLTQSLCPRKLQGVFPFALTHLRLTSVSFLPFWT